VEHNADSPEYNIYCLQETHSTSLDDVAWKKEWSGEIIFGHGQRNSKVVMILINKNFDLNVQIIRNDSQGRWVLLNMKVDEKCFGSLIYMVQIRMIHTSSKTFIPIY
jgi:hypothetical protein